MMNGPPEAPARSAPCGPGQGALARAATGLLGQALASEDAEAGGLHADDVLAESESAVQLLGDPEAWPAARHAVVQRYGRVGALLVVGYEGRWHSRRGLEHNANPPELETLLDRFAELSGEELESLLAAIERAEGLDPDDEEIAARRLLHATYAQAARDGTDAAHRAYMAALDAVMRQAARRLAS
jgi:hypothetical protein